MGVIGSALFTMEPSPGPGRLQVAVLCAQPPVMQLVCSCCITQLYCYCVTSEAAQSKLQQCPNDLFHSCLKVFVSNPYCALYQKTHIWNLVPVRLLV